jgi:hypothetical protein
MSKDAHEKTMYEAPVVVPLGEQLRAMGAVCKNGTGPADGACNTGFGGTSECGTGNSATNACGAGNTAGDACPVGTDPQAG